MNGGTSICGRRGQAITCPYHLSKGETQKMRKMEVVVCQKCGSTEYKSAALHVPRWGYLCSYCQHNPDGYAAKNDQQRGKPSKKLFSCSFEFETSYDCYDCPEQMELLRLGFIPTEDASIAGIEWKSPIYRNQRPFVAALKLIDRLGLEDIVGPDCGTHLHVGVLYYTIKDVVDSHGEDIFGPLTEEMLADRRTTSAFWGRFFTGYADHCRNGRYTWVNPYSRHKTLEYRLLKYRSKKQYLAASRFCFWVTDQLNKAATAEGLGKKQRQQLADTILSKYKEATLCVD